MSSLTEMNRLDSPEGSRFGTTLWELVEEAKTNYPEARDQLIRRYWYPLYVYLRRKGKPPEEARDLVQGFFARLLTREKLGNPEGTKSRFRSFLLASLDHFAISEWRGEHDTLKRGLGIEIVPLDEGEAERNYRRESEVPIDPAAHYDRAWAQMILAEARRRLRTEWERAGAVQEFDELSSTLEGEKTDGGYGDLAQRRQVTVGAIKKAVHSLRNDFRLKVRTVLAEESHRTRAELGADDFRDFYAALGS